MLAIDAIFFRTSESFLLVKVWIELRRTGRNATINSLIDAAKACETYLSMKLWQKAKF